MQDKSLRRMVLGIGNPDRGDDAAGLLVARLLADMHSGDLEVAEHGGEATGLLSRLDGVADAFMVDACCSGAPAGTVTRFDVATSPLPGGMFGLSTHGLGLAEAIELARALGQLPRRCVVYAIEGSSFETGAEPAMPVQRAAADVAARLRAELRACAKGEPHA